MAVQTGRDRMTIDDVVVKTASLLSATVIAAALTWALVPAAGLAPPRGHGMLSRAAHPPRP
ncbi:Bax inhibitor-1/YccA family protein [Micromonospora soli]|uniref:Bax inhibitor-1/YccA family membrane protein n=1 Tax=Micromonospora sp. NBRC 110009 TaxID=3061627 RepID=UPI002673A87E|nr:Bax inhibitor-1/YccA family protein [Micromonospora sp. NBRC 110009]WKT98482.1 Bax inhibitor-1/YccA family protein [Micromonospora sp. NBRC 110009]